MPLQFTRPRMAFLSTLLLGTCLSCTDRLPTSGESREQPLLGGARLMGELHCVGTPQMRTLDCREIRPTGGGGPKRAVFTSNNEVRLRSSNVRYDTTTLIFGFDVYAKNQIGEPVGTPDGTTVTGIKVFYHSGPTATSFNAPYDTGTITVANADGRQSFTGPDQPYHFYDQILQPQDSTPNKRWELRIPRSVNTFSFVLQVFTRVPSEPGADSPPNGFLISDDSVAVLYSRSNSVMAHPRMNGPYPRSVLLVAFRPNSTADDRLAAINAAGGRLIGGAGNVFYYILVPSDSSATELWRAHDILRALPQVEYVAPDAVDHVGLAIRPNDGPLWRREDWQLNPDSADGYNWGAEIIGAPFAWGCSSGDSALVWTIDSGDEHRQAVASVIGDTPNDSAGIAGIGYRSTVVTRDIQRLATPRPNSSILADDVGDALQAGAHVINLSIGAVYRRDLPNGTRILRLPDPTDSADVSLARSRGEYWTTLLRRTEATTGTRPLYVVGAGNFAMDASFSGIPHIAEDTLLGPRVLVVAASDSLRVPNSRDRLLWATPIDSLTRGSSFGDLVTLAAPGANVAIVVNGQPRWADGGTSYSAPHVTGAAALLRSFDPRLNSEQIRDLIVAGALRADRWARGQRDYPLLNAHESLRLAAERFGAPLCGNRVWRANNTLHVERVVNGVRTPEALPIPLDATARDFQVFHGGKRIDLYSNAVRSYSWTPLGATRWVVSATPRDTAVTGPTFRSSLPLTHDGDSTASLGSTTTILMKSRSDGGSRLIGPVPYSNTPFPGWVCTLQRVYPQGGTGPCLDSIQSGTRSSERANSFSNAIAPRGDRLLVAVNRESQTVTVGPLEPCYQLPVVQDSTGTSYYICRTITAAGGNDASTIYSYPLRTPGPVTPSVFATVPGAVRRIYIGDGVEEVVTERELASGSSTMVYDTAAPKHDPSVPFGRLSSDSENRSCVTEFRHPLTGTPDPSVTYHGCNIGTVTIAPTRVPSGGAVGMQIGREQASSSDRRQTTRPNLLSRLRTLWGM